MSKTAGIPVVYMPDCNQWIYRFRKRKESCTLSEREGASK